MTGNMNLYEPLCNLFQTEVQNVCFIFIYFYLFIFVFCFCLFGTSILKSVYSIKTPFLATRLIYYFKHHKKNKF